MGEEIKNKRFGASRYTHKGGGVRGRVGGGGGA